MQSKWTKWRRALALVLTTAMVGQNCMITSIGSDVVETAQTETAAAVAEEAAAAQRAAEEEAAAQKAAEEAAAAQKAAEEQAAAQKAAEEEAAAQKAAEEAAAAQKAAEEQAAAQKAAEEAAAAQKAAEEAAAAQKAAEEAAAVQSSENNQDTEGTGDASGNDAPAETQQSESETEEKATESEQPAEDKKNPESDKKDETKDEEKQETEVKETEKKEVTYRVAFDSHAVDHGQIQVKDEAGAVTADNVSSYYKEVKENASFTFTVVPAEGYTVEYVRADQADIPGTGNVNEYQIAQVTKNTVVTVTYKELPQDTASDEEENTEEDGQVKNTVTFQSGEGASVLVNGADVTNGTGQAVDGKIVFSVVPADGYEVTSVLVDGTIDARSTGNENEYIIEGIQTDETIVTVATEWVGTEEETETESETEAETEAETETESKTETESETETETETEGLIDTNPSEGQLDSALIEQPSLPITNGVLGGTTPLSISGANEVYVGESITLTSTNDWDWYSHTWEAEPTGVIQIVSNGASATLTGLKAGTVTVKHTYRFINSTSETFTVTVKARTPVSSIEITGEGVEDGKLALDTNDTATLSAAVLPDDAFNNEVTWSSSAPEVVSVNNGTLTALKAGEATITVEAKDGSNVKAEVKVTVTDVAVESITAVGEAAQTVFEDGQIQLAVTFTPENATNKELTWESDNQEIAAVDENGIVTGVKAGTTTITATSNANPDAVAAFTVTVEEIYMTEFSVVADRTTVTVGDTVNVRAIIKPDEYPNKEVTWESSDESIATVDENGLVTTHKTGTVEITGTSVADEDSSAFVTLLIEDVKAESVTINGYSIDYMLVGDIVQLRATVLPDNAADKTIKWISDNTDVLTVSDTGLVRAVAQGTTTVRALNDDTGLYDIVEITVYNGEPKTATVHVWVTNQNKNVSLDVKLPADGTPVVLEDVLPTYVSGRTENYIYCGPVYIHNYTGQPSWGQITQKPEAVRLRWYNGQIQYSSYGSGNSWQNVSGNNIAAQYDLIYSGNEQDDTDVNVILGDWPFTDGSTSKKTIQIKIYNSETQQFEYDSGVMYYSSGSDGDYGKIRFNCDESRYEVSNIKVERYDSENQQNPTIVDSDAEEPVSVEFGRRSYERYVVTATVRAKNFTVHYDSNGGTGAVPGDESIKAINGNRVTVKSSPQPTKEGFIFGGWIYDGKTYFGGESFEMPPENVTFTANWIPASEAIYYTVNDANMGTVSRTYERISGSTGDVKGSLATAKPGYRFVKWVDEKEQTVSTAAHYVPEKKAATYKAVFEINQYNIITKAENGTITSSATVKYNESKTIEYSANPGYKLKSVTVDGEDVTTTYPTSYTFSGVREDHTITVVYEKDESKWNDIIYTTEDLDNVTGMPEGETDVLAGTEQTVSTAEPTRAGYDFKGWTTTDVTVTADKFVMPEKDVTFTAQWEAIDVKYTVEYYYEDGGKYPDEATKKDERTAKTGTEVQVTDADKIPDSTYNNGKYSFDASAANVLSGTVAGDGSLVLKVYFKEASGVVRYNLTLAGATISGDGLTHDTGNIWKVANQYYEYPDTFTVTSAVPTCEGYVFVGWFDKARTSGNGNTNAAFRSAGETITYLYDATKDNNTYTLDAVWVKIGADDKTVTYDGEKHTIEAAMLEFVSGDLDEAYIKQLQGLKQVELSDVMYKGPDAEGYTEAVPKYTNAGSYLIQVKGTVSVGGVSYNLTTTATLTINPKEVIVTADNKTKAYGADDPEFTATPDGLLGDDTVTYNLSREPGEAVGTYTITPSGDTLQGNYQVTFKTGTLKIEKGNRTITVEDYTGIYDGAPHTIDVKGTVAGDKIEYSYDGGNTWVTKLATYTNVAETPVQIQVKVTNDNYQPSEVIEVGYVTISPFKMQVKADDKTKNYGDADPAFTATATSLENGKAKPDDGYAISYDSVFVRQPGEDVGTYTIYAGGSTKQGNYEVTYVNGTLTIDKIDRPTDPDDPEKNLSVTSYEDVYDGAYHSIVVNNLQAGDQVQYSYSYDGGESWTDELREYRDVTNQEIKVRVTNPNYTEETVELDGHVTITPKEVTVTADPASKVYGTADPELTATVSGTIDGETVAYELSREAGEAAGTYDITVTAEENQGNYHVTTKGAIFTITAADRETAVTVRPYSGEYDGGAHRISVEGTVDGDKVEYSYDGGESWTDELKEYTDVTKEPVKILVKVTNDNYEPIDELESSVYIWAKAVTVTGIDNGKVYGADDPELAAKVEGTLDGDEGKITYDVSRASGEDVGNYPIYVTGEREQGNYVVTYKNAEFTIWQAERAQDISVTSYEGTYDGAGHTITVNNLVAGDNVAYSYDGGTTWENELKEYADVTSARVEILVKVTNDNYKPAEVITGGSVTISPFKMQVQADDVAKKYGDADPAFTATVTSLENGKVKPDDGYAISYDSVFVRQPGEDVGTYTIYAGGNTKQGNYEVTYVNGTLTIEAAERAAALSVTSYEDVYDGAYHSIVVNNLQEGDKVEYSYDGGENWTDELEEYRDVTSQQIKVRVTNPNYTEETVELDGHVTITQKDVTVTANSASKVYGADDPELTAIVSGTINGEEVAYQLDREEGEAAGTYDISVTAEEDQGNYRVTTEGALFTIIPADRETAVTVAPYSGEYDGNSHTITVAGTADGDKVEYSYDGGDNWTDELKEYTDVTKEPVKILVKVTNDNYEAMDVLESSVYIWAKAVTVTGIDNGKVYGYEDPELTAEVTGTLDGDEAKIMYTVERATGEDVGTYPIYVTGEREQGNYVVSYVGAEFEITINTTDLKFVEADTTGYSGVYDGETYDAVTSVKVTGVGGTEIPAAQMSVKYRLSDEAEWGDAMPQVKDVEDSTPVQIQVTVANYAPIETTVEATVTPLGITITSAGGSKVYDGEPLTKNNPDTDITVTRTVAARSGEEGFVDGEGATYKITGSQTLVGKSDNAFEYTLNDNTKASNYAIETEFGELVVTDGTGEEPVDPNKVVVKTHEGAEYGLGDTVTFKIEVTNIYDEVKTITLSELAGVSLSQSEFKDVAPGGKIEATATYTITSEDILKGVFENRVTASFSGGKDFENKDEVTTEDIDASLAVAKTSDVPEGEKVSLNDVITYTITVTNNGNVPYTNLVVTDQLAGAQIQPGTGYTVQEDGTALIAELGVGATVAVTAVYTVTEADISAGTVHNSVTVTGDEIPDPTPDPDDPKIPEGKDDEEDPTDDRNPKLAVEKIVTSTPAAADGKYVLGETITYQVTVTNTGNLTLNDIVVTDVLTRPDGTTTVPSGFDVNNGRIDSLAPGASAQITYSHVVTEADLGGALANAATANGQPAIPDPDPTTPDPDPTPDEPGTVTVDTEDPSNCAITVTKQTTNYLEEAIVLEAGSSFQVALFSDESLTTQVGQTQTITYQGNSSTASVTFDNLKRGTYYVAEVDENGEVISGSTAYNGGVFVPQYANGSKVEITENGTTAQFAFANAFLIDPGFYALEKTLTITKNVRDLDGDAMNVNETFYAGIFTDESLTTLSSNVSENIVPLRLNGTSSVSVDVTVLMPTDGSEVTLYVAEVTSAGVPVENAENFAYTSEVDNGVVTLSGETEGGAAVVITNTSTEETQESECETTEEKTSKQDTSNKTGSSTKSVKTGDETPIMMLVCMLGISAMAIILLVSRRRRGRA